MPKVKETKAERLSRLVAEHESTLQKMGVGKRHRLRGYVPSIFESVSLARIPVVGRSASDTVPGNGTRRDLDLEEFRGKESAETVKAIRALASRIAPLYNKGPLQLVTNTDDLAGNGRRDR